MLTQIEKAFLFLFPFKPRKIHRTSCPTLVLMEKQFSGKGMQEGYTQLCCKSLPLTPTKAC